MAPAEWLNKGMQGVIEKAIAEKLTAGLRPETLKIINDSARHAGHAGDNGSGESHFNVVVVSDTFEGMDRIGRQRVVYDLLAEELKGPLHALSLKALTTREYDRV